MSRLFTLPGPVAEKINLRWILPALVGLPLLVLVAAGDSRPDPDGYPHGKFREDCSECHGADAWKPVLPSARRRHAKSGFPLEGAHAAAECGACHKTLDFNQSNQLCASCHEDPHRGELGVDCARCHGARSFLDPAVMRRAHQLTSFPLTGAHAALDCEGCHRPVAMGHLQFVATRAECQSCHSDLARTVRNPDHSNFPADCAQCHSTLGWNGSRFDHARTAFPLTGAHAAAACANCHSDGVYTGKSTACVSCHQSDYAGATPNHVASGFSTECARCHGTSTWDGAAFDHARSSFPLTGAHVTATCTSCHGDGVFAGKSAACISCHQSDYAGAIPNHATAGFPAECASCHGTTTWAGATFDHDGPWFPIYSGRHRGEWTACSDCHTSPTNYSTFTCLSCHPHNDRAETDGHHDDRAGYVYESQACYSCHPRGNS